MYVLTTSYKGYNQDFDSKIAKIVGRKNEGGGYCFIDDTRDIDFVFTRLDGLVNAKKRVQKKFKRKVSAKMYDKNGDLIHPNSLKGKQCQHSQGR